MQFYYLIKELSGLVYCRVKEASSCYAFNALMLSWRDTDREILGHRVAQCIIGNSNDTRIEIPASCIRKLYGNGIIEKGPSRGVLWRGKLP
jgi:hypothetical protein